MDAQSPRVTPAHEGVEGNEMAGGCAREAAESVWDTVDRRYLREARTQGTRDGIASHARSSRRYSIRPDLGGERRELAERY